MVIQPLKKEKTMSKIHDVTTLFESHTNGEVDINELEQEVKDIVSGLEEEVTITSEVLSVLEEEQA